MVEHMHLLASVAPSIQQLIWQIDRPQNTLQQKKQNWLVFEPTPLKNMSSSVGVTIPNWMEL